MRTPKFQAVLAATALLAGAAGLEVAHAQEIPVTITNQTGYKGPIYVTAYGSDNDAQPNTWYSIAQDGSTTKFPSSVKQPKNFGFSFSGAGTSFKIPMMQAARIYFSFCSPLNLTVAKGTPATPDATTPGNRDFNIPFDFVEYTWVPVQTPKNNTQMWVDTTQVDAFGFPIRMTLSGKPYGKATQLIGGFDSASAGPNIVAALKSAGSPWSNLMVRNGKWPIRVVSPVHAMAQSSRAPYHFPSNYWDSYISTVFNTYSRTSFTIDTGSTTYTGTVKNSQMVLTPDNGDPATIFAKPTSQQVWANGAPAVSGGNVAMLQTYIQAAFLRSTFATTRNLSDCSGMSPYAAAPINQYSKVIHEFAYNQGAYTFGYDDVCAMSSTISLLQPTALNLTLYPLAGNMANMTCP